MLNLVALPCFDLGRSNSFHVLLLLLPDDDASYFHSHICLILSPSNVHFSVVFLNSNHWDSRLNLERYHKQQIMLLAASGIGCSNVMHSYVHVCQAH